ncbi:MAG: 3-demethylubiquinone-9 3-methyltransferase [Polaromonas sp.]|nr:3-demethylubiquinone-9 3-methyltransferase [Polaromonas sp.]
MQVQPYLFFDGRCEEALTFYRTALGAEVTALMRFKDSPEPPSPGSCAPGSEEKIMHANFRIGQTELMASDGRAMGQPAFQGFSLSLSPPSDAEAQRLFSLLSEGGQVQMPLSTTFFASSFGMVADRFGLPWMIVVPLACGPSDR